MQQLRHSRPARPTDVYMQEIPESVKATIEAINWELRKPSPGPDSFAGHLC